MQAKAVVEKWFSAVTARDPERILALLSDDVQIRAAELSRPIAGKQVLRALLAQIPDAYESIRFEPEKLIESGNDVAALVRARVKFGKDLDVLGENLATAGKEIEIFAAAFLTVTNDKISRVVRIADSLTVARQLGVSAEKMGLLLEKLEKTIPA